jgi:hypothetical protein
MKSIVEKQKRELKVEMSGELWGEDAFRRKSQDGLGQVNKWRG